MQKHDNYPVAGLRAGDEFVLSPGAAFGRSARRYITVASSVQTPNKKFRVIDTDGESHWFMPGDTVKVWTS